MKMVIGAGGQLGTSFRHINFNALYVNRSLVNLEDQKSIIALLDRYRPETIINCAAYTDVNRAESNRELATTINVSAVKTIRDWCRDSGSRSIQFSTDYVFEGTKGQPLIETDPTFPLNHYGSTKRAAELLFEKQDRCWIFRTQWLFSPWGRNFLKTILSNDVNSGRHVSVVSDQIGNPTSAISLARAISAILDKTSNESMSGFEIFHLAGDQSMSWFDFANEIVDSAKQKQMSAGDLKVVAALTPKTSAIRRPTDSRLACHKAQESFGLTLPNFKDGLQETMDLIVRNNTLWGPSL